MTQHMPPPPPPLPPCPPIPPPDSSVQILWDTIETQARTIRYLLANYDMLLRKVEREMDLSRYYEVTTETGQQKTYHSGDSLPTGWFIPLNAALINFSNFMGGVNSVTVDQFVPYFSDGHAVAQANVTVIPIENEIVRRADA